MGFGVAVCPQASPSRPLPPRGCCPAQRRVDAVLLRGVCQQPAARLPGKLPAPTQRLPFTEVLREAKQKLHQKLAGHEADPE